MANAKSGLWVVGLVLVAAGSGFGAPKGGGTAVDVYLSSRDDSSQLLGAGTLQASAIFEKIGVRLSWHKGELPAGQGAFGIRTVKHAPESATGDALASAHLVGSSGTEITVYEDRVQPFLNVLSEHHSLRGVAAGYVLAHELAHVMQGVARHSQSGILKAQWCSDDLKEMMLLKLAFTDSDVELIHQGLTRQLAH